MAPSEFLSICVAILIPTIAAVAGEPTYTMVRATTGSGALRMTSASFTFRFGSKSPGGNPVQVRALPPAPTPQGPERAVSGDACRGG
jgi:hypothetical protein